MLLVVALHWVASYEGLYWSLDWYDIMMHFLGGLWACLFALWALNTQYGVGLRKYISIRNLILFVIVVGVAWELLEIVLKFTSITDAEYLGDTSLDIVMDMLGAGFAIYFYRKLIRSNEI